MGTFSLWHWIIVLIVVVIIFGGRGKISSIMFDVARGFKAFKKEVATDDEKKTAVKSSKTNKKNKN